MRTWECWGLHSFITLIRSWAGSPSGGHSCPVGRPQLAHALPHVKPFLQRYPGISVPHQPCVCWQGGGEASVCPCPVTTALEDTCNPLQTLWALLKLQNQPS